MKIKTRYIILCLTCMLLLVAPGMLFAVEPIAVKKPITMKGVYFSQTPPSAPLSAPLELKNIPPRPAPLTPQMRNQAINQIRGAIGFSPLKPVVPTGPVVPAHVFLTPDVPRSGLSNYAVHLGHNYPDPRSWTMNEQALPLSYVTSYSAGSFLLFTFDTLPGKTYMVDLIVAGPLTYKFEGVFAGEVNHQANHVIIGFTANSRSSALRVRQRDHIRFFFWRCELTQVN